MDTSNDLLLEILRDIKDRQDRHEEEHKEVRKDLSEIKQSLVRFKEHQKWELRIASCVWAGLMLGLSWVLGLHPK